jgi:ubiquitin fusion degradation protein 1
MGGRPTKKFDEHFRCYSTLMKQGSERDYVNFGGKILMPPSALEKLTRLHIEYPMNFELFNGQLELTTHAGVLEFTAEEGRVYMPPWVGLISKMLKNTLTRR